MNRAVALLLPLLPSLLWFACAGTSDDAMDLAAADAAVNADAPACPGLPDVLPGASTTFTQDLPGDSLCGLELSGAAALPAGGWVLAGVAGQGDERRAALIEIDRQGQPGRSWVGGPAPTSLVANPVVLQDGSVAILCHGGTPGGAWLARVDLGAASGAAVSWSLEEPGIAGWSLLRSSKNELWVAYTAAEASTPPTPGTLRRYAPADGATLGDVPLDPPSTGTGLVEDASGNAVYAPRGARAFDVRAIDPANGAETWRHTEGGSAYVADLARGVAGDVWAVGQIGGGAVEFLEWKVTRFASDGTVSWTKEDLPQACHSISAGFPGFFASATFVVPAPDGGALVGIRGEADRESVPRTVRYDAAGTVLWQVAASPDVFARIAAGDHAVLFQQSNDSSACFATVRILEVPFDAP